ncbi:Nramp family divalent metal transporter [Streptomyces gobiensis]|uniref:Nramp family divalent metal transporter n=1 Tax=Streptomyces gobiensis TaxID=2875706 RepID=UPI001E557E0A|nr:Nramp family divalent metal transporter [Streptomyces gobiensis]UGY94310.1 Nramp family divalent metal transporter [Streptomyces gobiensis]
MPDSTRHATRDPLPVPPPPDKATPDNATPPGRPGPLRSARARMAALAGVFGPAFVVAVAYVDPGNFATNMAAGARHGFLLLWVIAAANILAMFVQYLSAKVGIATGRNLPEVCREQCPRPLNLVLWAQAELVAIATDLAEFVGGAIALHLLFGVPLLPGAAITAVVGMAVLALAANHRRRFETVIIGMLAVVLVGFCYQVFQAGEPTGLVGGFVPRLDGADSLLLATGIVGATVMPHVIYLHSALTQGNRPRDAREQRAALRSGRIDISVALGIAGIVNMAMLVVAATVFRGWDVADGEGSLPAMHERLGALLGPAAAAAFAIALLAAGLASSSVGTYSGQVVMAGFLRRRVPLLLRRLVTMIPALAVLGAGVDPSYALVLSQVVLSFGIPFALVPLVVFTSRRDIMGDLVNWRTTTAVGIVVAAVISTLNLYLLVQPLLD